MSALRETWYHIRGIISQQLFMLAIAAAPESEKTSACLAVHDHLARVAAMLAETDTAGA